MTNEERKRKKAVKKIEIACVFGKAAKYVFARAKLLPRGDYVGT